MSSRRLRRSWEAVVVLAIAIVILLALWPEVAAFRDQPAARRELLAFTSALTLGMLRDEAVARIGLAGVYLRVADVDANLVIVDTPPTFGAGSWRAWLDFTDGKLARIRIRTWDGEHIKPAGSPPDVGGAGA